MQEVTVVERSNGKPICSGCGCQRPGYDRQPQRRFEFVPLWGIKVFLVYAPRRVDYPSYGVRVEQMRWQAATDEEPWLVTGKLGEATLVEREAEAFRTSWESLFRPVEMAVDWGRNHQDLSGVQAIGVDEIAWKKAINT